MNSYKYWLLQQFDHLDIDIINHIKLYCQIKIFNAPLYSDFEYLTKSTVYDHQFIYYGWVGSECIYYKTYVDVLNGQIDSIIFYYENDYKHTQCYQLIFNQSFLNMNHIKIYKIINRQIHHLLPQHTVINYIEFENFNSDGLYVFKENVTFIYDPND